MHIDVNVSPFDATTSEFARVAIQCEGEDSARVLDLEFSPLYGQCGIRSATVLDFLFFSSIVYAVDKMVSRKETHDNWTRELEVSIPVSDPGNWRNVKEHLEACLSFLTGDIWEIHFRTLECSLYRPRRRRRRRRISIPLIRPIAVCLFSGGLDSLIGAIDWLESNPQSSVLLVGHHDRDVSGPLSDQKALLQILRPDYPGRIDSLLLRVGLESGGKETTFRSRSLLFIALGLYAAHSISEHAELLIPENGTISLNVPLTPSRSGTCSTRTTHPSFLNMVRRILPELGMENPVINPFEFKTKGECVEQCLNQDVLNVAALRSVSCAKSGHRRTWLNRSAKGCGRCLPCIYRRASLHKIGLDIEEYGRDICTGDVNLDSSEKLSSDFRACLSFLRRNASQAEIASSLLINGDLGLSNLYEYADVVVRGMDEVRRLLSDKAIDNIKQRAGIIT